MDKNIAAILNDNAVTVHVTLNQDAKQQRYTYVVDKTKLQLNVGDTVVVHARSQLSLAVVQEVNEELEITPNDSIKYGWIIDKVDTDGYNQQVSINQQIEKTLSKSYQVTMRRSFAQSILESLPDAERQTLATLINPEK